MTCLTVKQFNAATIANRYEHQQQQIEAAEQLAKTISEYYPAQAMVRISENRGQKFFENTEVFLIHPLEIRVSFDPYKKKYNFFAWKLHGLRSAGTSDKREAEEAAGGEPQQVGVLTAKKVQAWVTYFEKYYAVLEVKNNATVNKIEAFRDSLKDLPVRWRDDKKSGTLTRGGLEFEFWIDDLHVSTNIKTAYQTNSDLKTFLAMSNNDLALQQASDHVSGKQKIQ